MPNTEDKMIFQTAARLLNRLPGSMRDELGMLLARAQHGQDTSMDVIDLLSKNENIRRWMQEQIASNVGDTRGFNSPAGQISSIPSSLKWICPLGCGNSLPVIQEDEDPPICERDEAIMVRAKKKRKG